MTTDIENLDTLTLRVGHFFARTLESDRSPAATMGLAFDASHLPEAPQLGEWICHLKDERKEQGGKVYPLWFCSHVETGALMRETAATAPWEAVGLLFGLLGSHGDKIAENVDTLRKGGCQR